MFVKINNKEQENFSTDKIQFRIFYKEPLQLRNRTKPKKK